MGRFLNADGQLNTNSLLGYNLLAYCENNPINKVDHTGHMAVVATAATISSKVVEVVLVGAIVVVVVALVYYLSDEIATGVKDTIETIRNIVDTEDQSVYVLTDAEHKVRYVGRTNNPKRREAEYNNNISATVQIFESITEDELMNLMGR